MREFAGWLVSHSPCKQWPEAAPEAGLRCVCNKCVSLRSVVSVKRVCVCVWWSLVSVPDTATPLNRLTHQRAVPSVTLIFRDSRVWSGPGLHFFVQLSTHVSCRASTNFSSLLNFFQSKHISRITRSREDLELWLPQQSWEDVALSPYSTQ